MDNMDYTKKAYLSFKLNGEIFAISVHSVLEVLENQKITKVPKTPFYIKGVINFRGEILPVIDVRLIFNMPKINIEKQTVVIVFEFDLPDKKIFIGGLVDGVKDVMEIADNEIKTVPDIGRKYNSDFIIGMVKDNNNFIMLLNIEKVLSAEQLVSIIETEKEEMIIEAE